MALGPVASGWGDSFPIHTSIRASVMMIPNPANTHLRRGVCVPPFSGTSPQRQTTQALLGHKLKRDGA